MPFENALDLIGTGGSLQLTTDGTNLIANGQIVTPTSTNVKSFGAKGDGVSNDTVAIQAAISATGSGGGIVNIPAGTFMSGQITLPANVTFSGAGVGATTIKLIAGSNQDLVVTQGFAGFVGGTSNGPQKFGLQNLTLDANGANQTGTARCFAAYGYNYRVENVWFLNGLLGGVYSEWGGSDNPMETFWSNFKIYNYMGQGAVGMDWNGPHDAQLRDYVIATLASSITPTTSSTYGTTAIGGTTLTIPSNSANGGAGSFTFATTVAADPTLFPTTGGAFTVLSTNSLTTYVTISYTSAATVSNVTTFSGCTASVPANVTLITGGSIICPAYGLRINGGAHGHGESGPQMMCGHIWGRNHFALWSAGAIPYYASNMELEGAFIANAILTSKSRFTGVVYGTNGQTGQTNESGILVGGDVAPCSGAMVDMIAFNIGGSSSVNGCSLAVINSSGGNMLRVTGTSGNPNKFAFITGGSPDKIEALCYNNFALSLIQDFTATVHVFPQASLTNPAIVYSASMTPNASAGPWQRIVANNGTAFAINAPIGQPGGGSTVELTIEVSNTSGGALGAASWNAAFVFQGFTWTNPGNGKKRFATFKWNGVAWICTAMASADY